MGADLFRNIAAGEYISVLTSDPAGVLIRELADHLVRDIGRGRAENGTAGNDAAISSSDVAPDQVAAVGLAALNAFLQLNVTGPVLESVGVVERIFDDEFRAFRSATAGADAKRSDDDARRLCLRYLDVDGVSVYPYIPCVQLFALARYAFTARITAHMAKSDGSRFDVAAGAAKDPALCSLSWLRLRVHVWHHKLFIHPNLGPNSGFNRGAQWSDVPSLQQAIMDTMAEAEGALLPNNSTVEQRAQFQLEKANACIMLGLEAHAKTALAEASRASGFVYALSGALGKRTRFQENSTSQLVVLAKSSAEQPTTENIKQQTAPEALPLNDDTLLEAVDFADAKASASDPQSIIPAPLRVLTPDNQPQLLPLDQIILLAEATLKDALSPVDSLTAEEILPFAERVVSDQKSTNWQIYTQALLVRSRIEVHRSRTVERGVLQMQAVVDQVLVDTTGPAETLQDPTDAAGLVPSIAITSATDQRPITTTDNPPTVGAPATPVSELAVRPSESDINRPTSFFPAPKPSETAPAQTRLLYIHALSSPPRWHLESELAFAWTGVGSLVTAVDIFKRLRLWAEVALCLAAAGAHADEDDTGRGSGGEEKARDILRWRLFQPTDAAAPGPDLDSMTVDVSALHASSFQGGQRDPAPSDAPRLFCILGDLENDPAHYEAAWNVSGKRYARAQRALGEYLVRQQDWAGAREAYLRATGANRLSSDMWSRLGEINLRLASYADAAEAFRRSITATSTSPHESGPGAESAHTWSNLGSALYSMHCEAVEAAKRARAEGTSSANHDSIKDGVSTAADEQDDDDKDNGDRPAATGKSTLHDPSALLAQSLAAYKRGATLAHQNWRIWDNVVTIASRSIPPNIAEILPAMREILRIRASEDSIDAGILRLLLDEALLSSPAPATGVYEPPRGSLQRRVCDFVENDVVPLITSRADLWSLVGRVRVWRRDFAGSTDAAEKAWRASVGTGGAGVSGGGGGSSLLAPPGRGSQEGGKTGEAKDWREDEGAWNDLVERTGELVSVLENYGPDVEAIGTRWKAKARTAIRSVMGKGKENWEGSEGWTTLERLLDGLQ